MLPPYIIEQIRKREEDAVREQPVVQLPLPAKRLPILDKPSETPAEGERGVVIIDLG